MKAGGYIGELCHYCWEDAETMDHIVPKALGGTVAKSNLVPACIACNQKKADNWPDVDHRPGGCPICKEAVRRFRLLRNRHGTRASKLLRAEARAEAKTKVHVVLSAGMPEPDGITLHAERIDRGDQGSWAS